MNVYHVSMDTKQRIGQKIKELREMCGKTQTEYSKVFGKSRGAIADMEAGRYLQSVEFILEVAKYHNVTTDSILFGEKKEA